MRIYIIGTDSVIFFIRISHFSFRPTHKLFSGTPGKYSFFYAQQKMLVYIERTLWIHSE